jgi:Bacterial regulatory proteins, tetR family
MPRPYRLGRRQPAVDRTASAILRATLELVAERPSPPAVAAIARRAGVSRATVYNRFGSRSSLLAAITPTHHIEGDDLREHLQRVCATWAESPALYRNLPPEPGSGDAAARRIAERLAQADALRPGCSIKEAEDVIALLTTFPVFDRLHRDGRRSPAAVTDVLMRLAGGILA